MKIASILFFLLLSLQSCKEVISEDITARIPNLLLPKAGSKVTFNPVHFKWSPVYGATSYRLQIARPSFAAIEDYVLDSVVSTTDFYFEMDSSEYELKLTAYNSGYHSQTLGPIKFSVSGEESTSPGTAVVPLISPAVGVYVNKTFEGNFTWGAISGGSDYQFKLVKGTSFVDGTEIYSSSLSNSFEATLPTTNLPLAPGQYFWGVKAYIGASEQLYTSQHFYVDTTAPNTALLDLPLHQSNLTAGIVSFSWHFNGTQEVFPAPVTSTLEIATDQTFTSGTGGSIIHTYAGTDLPHDFTMTQGTYYWRVRNEDGAGNLAPVSEIRQLIIL